MCIRQVWGDRCWGKAGEKTAGFTLMEVLIALLITAFVITSAAVSLGRSHGLNAHLEKKIAADIVARNLMDRHRFNLPHNKMPKIKQESGNISMAGFDFSYVQTITPASMPELKKVDIVIYDEDGESRLRSLSMFVGR